MKQDTHKTKVRFLKLEGDVLAVFPDEPWDTNGNTASYMHAGQHGGTSIVEASEEHPLATPEEYNDLKKELEQIGYNLTVLNKEELSN